jgi:hypothetical protein
MKGFLRLALGAAVLAALPATASAAVELAPSSDWSLDYADDSCALRRSFGTGEDLVWLEIRQLAPWTPARITVAATDFPRKRRKAVLDRAPVLRFLPGGTEERYSLVAFGEYGEGLQGLAIYALILPPPVEGAAAPGERWRPQYFRDGRPYAGHSTRSTAIELSGAFERDVVLKTGDLHRPFEAMGACMDDLAKHWDLASAMGVELSQQPEPRNLEIWAEPIMERFPRELQRFGGPTSIRARVIVGADGRPEQCRIIEPVVDADYERRTCGIVLSDGQYEPARDAAGAPVRALYVQEIVYLSAHYQRMQTAAAKRAGETAATAR